MEMIKANWVLNSVRVICQGLQKDLSEWGKWSILVMVE